MKKLILSVSILMILVACKEEQKPMFSDVEKEVSTVVETEVDTIEVEIEKPLVKSTKQIKEELTTKN